MTTLDCGPFGELLVRTARKSGRCQYGRRVTGGPRCTNEIKQGDKYVEGEPSLEYAGGFGGARWCMECVATFAPALKEAEGSGE